MHDMLRGWDRRLSRAALAALGALTLIGSAGVSNAAAQSTPEPSTRTASGAEASTPDTTTPTPSAERSVPAVDATVPELDDVIIASAPVPPVVSTEEFEQVEPLLERVGPLRLSLDDELGDDVPWTDYDPYTEHGPEGLMHLGAQLRGSALLSADERRVPLGPSLELAAFVDFRFSRRARWHLRMALGISWQTHVEDFLGAGRWVTSSPGALRLRIQPFAMDIGRYFALRLGPSIGAQLVPRASEDGFAVEVFGGGTAELALRLMDGLLEIGVHAGVQMTGVGDAQRPNDFTPAWRTGVIAQPVLGVSAAGMLP